MAVVQKRLSAPQFNKLSLFQNRLFCHRLLQFFGLEPAKLRIFKVAVPKTEVLEQPQFSILKYPEKGK
jgi:hypothetical protein